MKRRVEIVLIFLLPILGLVFLGGKIMNMTKKPEQKVTASSSKKAVKKSEEEIKKEQIAYLKEHEQEIIDFVKAQNTKVESVQIDWDETQMSDGGMFNTEYYMNVYGHINNNENSSWGVDIPLENNEKVNLNEMFLGSYIRINGEPIS